MSPVPPGCSRRAYLVATLLAATLIQLGTPGSAFGQALYATPEVGTSQRRGPALGARLGAQLVGGLDVVGQALVFFPEEDGVADPGVGVSRTSWHASANLLYFFDRDRPIAPYVGVGLRYGRATLEVIVDGLRAREVADGFATNLLGGVSLPRLPGRPFVEYRGGGTGGWVLTGGARIPLGSL